MNSGKEIAAVRDRCVLGVFAKEPRPGHVKTRLAAAMGAEQAARLYEACLCDFLDRIEPLNMTKVIAYSPESAADYFERLAQAQFRLVAQCQGDLGERMRAFFHQQFQKDASRVVLVGSDSPDLPIHLVGSAFALLEVFDIVLGPSHDGGYYLVGMNRWIPELFDDVPWGSETVLKATLANAEARCLRVALLDPWYDLDRVEDVSRLWERIGEAERAGSEIGLRRIKVVIAETRNISLAK